MVTAALDVAETENGFDCDKSAKANASPELLKLKLNSDWLLLAKLFALSLAGSCCWLVEAGASAKGEVGEKLKLASAVAASGSSNTNG